MAGAPTPRKYKGTPQPPNDPRAPPSDPGLAAPSDPEAAVLAALGLDDSP